MRPSVLLVAGARPNFMKVAPLYRAFERAGGFEVALVHTGQHYDAALSTQFFQDLQLPEPHVTLEVGSASHGVQTARVLERFERVLEERRPEFVIVVGDVNSTLACAIASAKIAYPSGRKPALAHVEAGLRSFDRTMPEEINRIVTDHVSDFLFTSEASGTTNLLREGVPPARIHFVGNVMIDTLRAEQARALALETWKSFGFAGGDYAVLTLHRPANVDRPETLGPLLEAIGKVAEQLPVVFPAHPRTQARIDAWGLGGRIPPQVHVVAPLGYVEFLSLMARARIVLTDSGGVQEETTILRVPCLTLRDNTERPVTITHGTNMLVGAAPHAILEGFRTSLARPPEAYREPELWDGHAGQRIVAVLEGAVRRGETGTAGE